MAPSPPTRGTGPSERADTGRRDGPRGDDEREGEGDRRVDEEVEAPHGWHSDMMESSVCGKLEEVVELSHSTSGLGDPYPEADWLPDCCLYV